VAELNPEHEKIIEYDIEVNPKIEIKSKSTQPTPHPSFAVLTSPFSTLERFERWQARRGRGKDGS
jgi:hypothetical protein